MSLKAIEVKNPDSCLNRAKPDEPIFVLRANDGRAAAAVRFWANYYYQTKGGWHNMTPRERRKWREAVQLALDMVAYRARKNP